MGEFSFPLDNSNDSYSVSSRFKRVGSKILSSILTEIRLPVRREVTWISGRQSESFLS